MPLFFLFLSAFYPLYSELSPPVICLKSLETDDCFISFLRDSSKNEFVIKQVKDPSPDEQFLLVLDALGCHIAEQIGVSMNRVSLIPPSVSHIGKKLPSFPATLHTLAKGLSITEETSPYHLIDIHQRYRKENSPMWKKWGPLPLEETGLTRRIIQNMAKHPDLPKIVALDTFLGNADRSAPNLFYDEESDRFCGIDMAAAFNTELAKEACGQIASMEGPFSQAEKAALKEYVSTLEILLKKYPAEELERLLLEYAKKGGFIEGSDLWNEGVQERIEHHKRRIRSNCTFSKELVFLIEDVRDFEKG